MEDLAGVIGRLPLPASLRYLVTTLNALSLVYQFKLSAKRQYEQALPCMLQRTAGSIQHFTQGTAPCQRLCQPTSSIVQGDR